MAKNNTIRLVLLLILLGCHAEKDQANTVAESTPQEVAQKIELQLSARVDTTNNEVKEVVKLYENYIHSQPDSIYDNSYWNSAEKAQYRDFDFSRSSIYNGISSNQLFKVYMPFVLSVEPKGEKYEIRVLYSNSATEPPYVGSKVWCIHKLMAVREKGAWKLENYLQEKTKDWQKTAVGFFEYVYPRAHGFDTERAGKAKAFCENIIERFNPGFNNPFKFYLAAGKDDMGELENFDYYFTGITTGKAREGMIFSSRGDEYYPHEFVHQLLPVNEDRGHVMEEGLATFLGTKENLEEYFPLMQKLAKDYQTRESYSLENILNNQTAWNGYQVAYPAGALICEVLHEEKGDAGINKLIRDKTKNYDEIMRVAKEVLQLEEAEVIRLIEEKLKAFE